MPGAIKKTQKVYTCCFIYFEFRNEQDFRRASGGKWYWTGFARSHTLADTWFCTRERKQPFRAGNPRTYKLPEIYINHWINDNTDQWCTCDSNQRQIHVLLDSYSCIIRHVHQRCEIYICVCILFILRSPNSVFLILTLTCKASLPSFPIPPSFFRGNLLHNILSHLLFTSCSYPEVSKR